MCLVFQKTQKMCSSCNCRGGMMETVTIKFEVENYGSQIAMDKSMMLALDYVERIFGGHQITARYTWNGEIIDMGIGEKK